MISLVIPSRQYSYFGIVVDRFDSTAQPCCIIRYNYNCWTGSSHFICPLAAVASLHADNQAHSSAILKQSLALKTVASFRRPWSGSMMGSKQTLFWTVKPLGNILSVGVSPVYRMVMTCRCYMTHVGGYYYMHRYVSSSTKYLWI